jgi:hypothetical protein
MFNMLKSEQSDSHKLTNKDEKKEQLADKATEILASLNLNSHDHNSHDRRKIDDNVQYTVQKEVVQITSEDEKGETKKKKLRFDPKIYVKFFDRNNSTESLMTCGEKCTQEKICGKQRCTQTRTSDEMQFHSIISCCLTNQYDPYQHVNWLNSVGLYDVMGNIKALMNDLILRINIRNCRTPVIMNDLLSVTVAPEDIGNLVTIQAYIDRLIYGHIERIRRAPLIRETIKATVGPIQHQHDHHQHDHYHKPQIKSKNNGKNATADHDIDFDDLIEELNGI